MFDSSSPDASRKGETPQRRKAYHRPTLLAYGDFRDVTLGGSPGIGESLGARFRSEPNGLDLMLEPNTPTTP